MSIIPNAAEMRKELNMAKDIRDMDLSRLTIEEKKRIGVTPALVRVGIVDDHAVVRAGLRNFLAQHDGLQIVGEAASGREAIDLARTVGMDVLLLDLSMPGQSGMDAMTMIRAKAPDVGILVLSGYSEEQYAVTVLRHGASGYLSKECDPLEIVKAIRTIGSGRRYFTPAVAELLARKVQPHEHRHLPHELLSDREFQVFLKLAQGQMPGQIGEHVALSPKTVSSYRTRIMEKMELSTNSELTYYAMKHKLIQ
jgi:two-component system, NarL family, invasion response regulator UvrY